MEGVGGLACPVGVWFPEPSFPGSKCGAVWQRQALVSGHIPAMPRSGCVTLGGILSLSELSLFQHPCVNGENY